MILSGHAVRDAGGRQVGLASRFVESIQRKGRLTFTGREFAKAAPIGEAARRAALRRLAAKGRIRRLTSRRDFFVIVPPEYAAMGGPPLAFYLGPFMRDLGLPYYVGLLSAAEWYGAAHFAVQGVQVVTAVNLRPIKIGRETITFVMSRNVERTPRRTLNRAGAKIEVSTPEATLLDLVRYTRAAGGLNRVATIVASLGSECGVAGLREALRIGEDVPSAQRLGYLLELTGHAQLVEVVAQWLQDRRPRRRRLEPAAGSAGEIDDRWNLRINVAVEVTR